MESSSSSSNLLATTLFQYYFSLIFFAFTVMFIFFSMLVFVVRIKYCCNCDVCRSYLNMSWTSEFDNLVDWYTHLLANSPSKTIHIHVVNNTITANPENVEYMLKTRFDNYPKGKMFQSILGDLLGRGIFNVDGESWRFQRKMASLELGSVSIRNFAFEIVTSEITRRLIPLVSSKEGEVLDMQDVFRRFAFDSICRFSFGLDPGCLELSMSMSMPELAVAFDLASRLSAERALCLSPWIWKTKRMLNIGSEKKLRKAITKVNVLADEVIKQRRRLGFGDQDLLCRFMGSVSDDKYLRDIVVSFLLAGRDTVSSGLTSFFFLLSKHPEVVEAILEESDRVIGSGHDGLASFEQLREMPYLQAALHECMRLYPPVQFDSKYAQDDNVLADGTFVKRGTRVTYHPYAMGRMEDIWGSDCLEFKPEKWLNNGLFRPENPFKYPVFQAGLRVCLGKEMALVEMKSIALSLIRRFKMEVVDPVHHLRFAPGLTATVKGGLPVRVRTRQR